jgi:hypothetical protein
MEVEHAHSLVGFEELALTLFVDLLLVVYILDGINQFTRALPDPGFSPLAPPVRDSFSETHWSPIRLQR